MNTALETGYGLTKVLKLRYLSWFQINFIFKKSVIRNNMFHQTSSYVCWICLFDNILHAHPISATY